jgi:hypothetical protein
MSRSVLSVQQKIDRFNLKFLHFWEFLKNQKLKKSGDKLENPVGLLFAIQNLNFKWKNQSKPIDKPENRVCFQENQAVFSFPWNFEN